MTMFSTIGELLSWCKQAPTGTRLDVHELAEILDPLLPEEGQRPPDLTVEPPGGEWTWRERLWVVPAERRLGTREVLEALGRSRTWLHERMKEDRGPDRLPHRKLDGELVFTAGEVRSWIRDQEVEIHGGPMDTYNPPKLEAA